MIFSNNKDLLISVKVKKLSFTINDLLENVPRKDFFYKDKTNNYILQLLQIVFELNECSDINSLNQLSKELFTSIAMISFLLERFHKKGYISETSTIKLASSLIEIKKMSYVWIKNKKEKLNC